MSNKPEKCLSGKATKSMEHVEKRISGLNNQVGLDNSVKVQNKFIKIHEWNMGKFWDNIERPNFTIMAQKKEKNTNTMPMF